MVLDQAQHSIEFSLVERGVNQGHVNHQNSGSQAHSRIAIIGLDILSGDLHHNFFVQTSKH
jgi:hypothetical protein